ncbi:hypothetical protein ES332_D05G197300v1 [Gossypium tomentosum]|uniref:Uncharacterized protein n=1 Tax=Gossypium tomentosum TaxID=34277 RepID=A0A5D2KXR9_GOSTO|nr:hypothetical protein ES332_D05G197300v1 [Gossypium tomentosum]
MKWMNTRIANYDKLLMLFAKDTEKRDGAKGGHLGSPIGGRVSDGIPLQDVVGASMEEKDTNDTSQVGERGQPRVYSEQEVFAELVNIGAYIFLTANAGRVRAFFGCSAEERKEFLLQMMYTSSGDPAY